MNPIAIDNDFEESELQMKHNHHHHIGMVSPDFNSCNGNNIAKKCCVDAKANNIVSPDARTSFTSPQPQNHDLHVVTPLSSATPTKYTPSPLKSPFRNSMALLDSKLDSLKKEDVALHAKIESMNAWLDGSGMEDSFDGELVFDVDFGDLRELCDEADVENEQGGVCLVERDSLKELDFGAVDEFSINSDEESKILADAKHPFVGLLAQSEEASFFISQKQSACDVQLTGPNYVPTANEIGENSVAEAAPNGQPQVVKSFDVLESKKHNSIRKHETSTNTSGVYYSMDDNRKEDALEGACIEDNLSCKQHLGSQTGLSNHVELDECQSAVTSEVVYLHKTQSEATSAIGRVSHCKTSLASISEIGKISSADLAAPANCHTIPSTERNLSFFSPVDASESQIYFTPYNRNSSLDSRQSINLFSTTTATVYGSAGDATLDGSNGLKRRDADFYGRIEVDRKLFSTGHSRTSNSEPSLCPTDVSTIQELWTDHSSIDCEAVNDLSKFMSALKVDSAMSMFEAGTASSHIISNASCCVSSAQSCNSGESSSKQHSSPIQPKKLDLVSGDDAGDTHKHAISAQHYLLVCARDSAAQENKSTAIVSEVQSKLGKASICCDTGSGLASDRRLVIVDCTESKNWPIAPEVKILDESIVKRQTTLASTECLSSVSTGQAICPANDASYDELLALVSKLRYQLAEVNATCEVVKSERDALRLERDVLLETNRLSIELKSKADEKGNHEETTGNAYCSHPTSIPKSELVPSTQISTTECSFLSGEDELEQAIELVISSARSKAGSNIDTSKACISCNSCVRFADQVTCLKLENERLKSELEKSHQGLFTPSQPPICMSPDASACAKPVDLETLFSANSRNDDGSSTSSSHYAQSSKLSALEDSLRNTIQSRNQLKKLYHYLIRNYQDLERNLRDINAEKNSAIDELKEASSLVSLLESSHESLQSDKLIAEQQRDELKLRVDDSRKHLNSAKSELQLMDSKFNAANDAIKSMNDKINELQSERKAYLEKLKRTEHQLTEANIEIDLISDERTKQEEKIKGLLSCLTAVDEEKSVLEDSLAELSQTIDDLQQQINQKESIIDDLSHTINEMKGEMASCFERLEDAESKLNSATYLNDCALEHLWTPKKKANTLAIYSVEQHQSPQEPKIQLIETTRDESPKVYKHQDRFKLIAANLSVIVLQQKLRASRAKRQQKSKESDLFDLSENLAVAETSIGELNVDRRRLAEDVVRLTGENEILSLKLEECNMSRPTSEALVLEDECGVEAVNCFSYSSLHNQTEVASSESNLNLQSTIAKLALALVKLKIRERSLLRKANETRKNEVQLQNKLMKLQKHLPKVVNEANAVTDSMADFKSEIVNTIRKEQKHLLRELRELSPASMLQHKVYQLLDEKQSLHAQITRLEMEIRALDAELQTKNYESQCTNNDEASPGSRDIDREVNDLVLQIDALKREHEQEKSDATDELDQVKFYLLHEKEAASLLRAQLDKVLSQNDELTKFSQTREEEHHRLAQAASSLKAENDSLSAAEYEHDSTMAYKKVKSCEHELELSEKLRLQLQSQLDAETNALNLVHTQKNLIGDLNSKIEELSHESEAKEEALSTMNCKIISLASERDNLSAQLASVADEFNTLRSEHENLKYSYQLLSRDESDRTDSSVKTFSSCEHLGTVCEEERPLSPGRDIIEILSAPQLSKTDIQAVSDKMHQLHSILSKVQEERSSLKQEVKQLREFKDSSSHLAMLLRKNSDSLRSHLIESQNEVARLKRKLQTLDQPRITNFASPFTTFTSESNRPQFELSLETPRVSNLATKHHAKSSPKYRKSKSPQESNKVRSKERFEVKKGISLFNMFKDTKKSGRKDFIKYRNANKDSHSINSFEPISPGEKRKREQAELMIKSLRRRYEV